MVLPVVYPITWLNEYTAALHFTAVAQEHRASLMAVCQGLLTSALGGDAALVEHRLLHDCVVGYDQLMLVFEKQAVLTTQQRKDCALRVAQILQQTSTGDTVEPTLQQTLRIPVFYDASVGPDLTACANRAGLSIDSFVQCHTSRTYSVKALGFAPGFAYLGYVAQAMAQPRHETPRLAVPAGSVGVAGRQTGIYPRTSPGGWQIIGQTPLRCFRPELPIEQACVFSLLQSVMFYPISEREFLTAKAEALHASELPHA